MKFTSLPTSPFPRRNDNRFDKKHLAVLCSLIVFLFGFVGSGFTQQQGLDTKPTSRNRLPELVLRTGHSGVFGGIKGLAFSPDGKLLATCAENSTKLWDVKKGIIVRTLFHSSSWPGFNSSIAFNPDGTRLAAGYPDGSIQLWNVLTGEAERPFVHEATSEESEKASDGVTVVAFSRNGKFLASGNDSGFVRLWDISTRKGTLLAGEHTDSVTALMFSPDGRWLASGCESDGRIKIWNVSSGQAVPDLFQQGDETECENLTLSFRNDAGGSWFASASTTEDSSIVKLWELDTWKNTKTYSPKIQLGGAVGFSKDGLWYAATTGHGQIRIFQLDPWTELTPLTLPFSPQQFYMASALTFSEDKRYVAYVPSPFGTYYDSPFTDKAPESLLDDSQIRIWDLSNRRLLPTPVATGHPSNYVSFSSDGKQLITVAQTAIHVWNLEPGLLQKTIGGPFSVFGNSIASDDGRLVATQPALGKKSSLQLWNLTSNKEPASLAEVASLGLTEFGNQYSFGPGWRLLAFLKTTSVIGLMDVTTGKTLPDVQIKDGDNLPRLLDLPRLSPNGKWLAVFDSEGDNTKLSLLDTSTWKVAFSLDVPTNQSYLTFSPDSQWLAATANDGTRVWNVKPNSTARLFERFATNLAFSRDSKTLALGGFDGRIRLIDVASGNVLRTTGGNTQGVNSLSFSHDDAYLASGSSDGTTRIWDLKTGDSLVSIIALTKGNWLAITPDGLFDGTADAMREVSWRVGNTNRTLAVDTFFTDFYYPGLLADILSGKKPKAERDIVAEMLVPGLRAMIASGIASIKDCDTKQPRLCFKASAIPPPGVPLTGLAADSDFIGSLDLNDLVPNQNSIDCAFSKPLDVTATSDIGTSLCDVSGRSFSTAWDSLQSNVSGSTLHVLTIAVDKYKSTSGLPPLKHSVAGARALAAFFAKQKATKASPFSDIRIWDGLFDQAATRDAIRSRLEEIAGEIKENDVLFLFFSGHGVVPSGQEMFYFAPADTRFKSLQDTIETGLTSAMMADALRAMPARRVFLVIDACQSGGVVDSLGRVGEAKASIANRRRTTPNQDQGVGVYIIASTTPLQIATQQDLGFGNGPIVTVLLEALNGRAAATTGPLRARALADYVQQRIPEISAQSGLSFTPLIRTIGLDFPIAGPQH